MIAPGAAIAPVSQPPITREQLRAYAEASGDPNLIHLDDEAAKAAGLPGIIAHGMLIAAFLAERAERFVAEEAGAGWRLAKFQTRFRGMTLLGDVVSVSGKVKAASAEELLLELHANNQKGDTLTTGTVRFARATGGK